MQAERLRVPAEHGALLAVPSLDTVPDLVATNRTILRDADVSVLGRPLQGLQAEARRWMVRRGAAWLDAFDVDTPPADGPVVMTGHQPTLYHPGVWVKNFVAAGAASQVGGAGWNLVVDYDVPKTLGARVPIGTRDAPQADFVPLDDFDAGVAYEEIGVRDEGLFTSFPDRVGKPLRRWGIEPLVDDLWAGMPASADSGLVERLTVARTRLERRLGCANGEIPASELARSRAFGVFALDILARLPEFVRVYNGALADYRIRYKVRSSRNPLPDLAVDGETLETPFWIWGAGRVRDRLYARHRAGEVTLHYGNEGVLDLDLRDGTDVEAALDRFATLDAQGLKVRVRALTNTLWCRLFLCDLFVHGIGGALYDRVTDEIIRHYYRMEPPRFLTASATLVLPIDPHPVMPIDASNTRHLLRDFTYNPDRHLDGSVSQESSVAELVTAKQRRIAETPRNAPERRCRFDAIRQINRQLQDHVRAERLTVRDALGRIESQLAANAILRSREYAFCLFPLDTLAAFYRGVTGRA